LVTISETEGTGRTKKNIIAPRALFLDFDAKNGQFIDEDKLKKLPAPSAKIRSGGGYHLYWFLNINEPLDALEPALARLLQYMGSDPSIKDMGRVLRLAGSLHQKGEPFLVTMDYCEPDNRYTIAEVMAGIPEALEPSLTRLNYQT
jgi:hypothetical protein